MTEQMQENGYTAVREREESEEGEEDGVFNIRGMLRENDEWMSIMSLLAWANCRKKRRRNKIEYLVQST